MTMNRRAAVLSAAIFALAILLGACAESDLGTTPDKVPTMADIQVPEGFKFATRTDHTLCVQVANVNDDPYPEVLVTVSSLAGEELAKGLTDPAGGLTLTFALSNLETQVAVTAPAIGVVQGDTTITLQEVVECLVIQ